jgi:5-methylcytosine-specific restriction protein A
LGQLFEGAKRTIIVNSYERNSLARRLCIGHYGTTCSVCNFDFVKEYGEIGNGFIHVHHLTRVADIGKTYEIDPIKDLRPVCPNCHSMLHSGKDALTIEELKNLYDNAEGRQKTYR